MPSSSRTATERPILLGIPPHPYGLSFPNPCPPDPDPDPDDNSSHSDVPSTDHSTSSKPSANKKYHAYMIKGIVR